MTCEKSNGTSLMVTWKKTIKFTVSIISLDHPCSAVVSPSIISQIELSKIAVMEGRAHTLLHIRLLKPVKSKNT